MSISLHFFSLIITCTTILSGVNARAPLRIVNGNNAEPGEFPYIISLRFEFKTSIHICGGSIISSKHIITAAHCVDWLYPRDIIIASGITRQNDGNAMLSKVKKIVRHPGFARRIDGSRIQNDLAVLTLTEALNLDGFLRDAIKLPTKPWVPHTVATVAGWGYRNALLSPNYSKDVPNDLSKLDVTIITHEECAKKRTKPFEYQICATKHNATICQGDSGGPLVVDDFLIGIVSTTSCKLGSYSGYMDTYYFREFIQDAMKNN